MLFLLLLQRTTYVAAWTTLTLYDVLPEDCRTAVGNNDVGNVPGDMYFMLKDKYLPVVCAECQANPGACRHDAAAFDCTNPESTGRLVVRKIEVEVQSVGRSYQLCDVWKGSAQCEYTCFDPHVGPSGGIGSEPVCGGSSCQMAPPPSFFHHKNFDYWNFNTAARLGDFGNGTWYSLVAGDAAWRNAKIVKTINGRCQASRLA